MKTIATVRGEGTVTECGHCTNHALFGWGKAFDEPECEACGYVLIYPEVEDFE